MDYVTRLFIVFTKKLCNDIAALRKSIEALSDQQERHHQEDQAQRQLPPPPIHLADEVKAEVHKTKDEQRQNRTQSYATLGIQAFLALGTWLAFFAAAYYASVARSQLEQMTIAAKAAQDAVTEAKDNRIQSDKAFQATVDQFQTETRVGSS